MVSFQTKNANLGKFWGALDWNMLIYFTVIWNILHLGYFWTIWDIFGPFTIFYRHLGYFWTIWDIFGPFGIFLDHLVHFVLI
jgi:hypothetical protein